MLHNERVIGFLQVRSSVEGSLRRLYELDGELLTENASERTLINRLSIHLAPIVESWSQDYRVDVEYNRMGESARVPKRLIDRGNVQPDLIIHRHKRSGPANNLLIVEAKKNPRPRQRVSDLEKLSAYLADEELTYRFGLYLELRKLKPRWLWLRNGDFADCRVTDVW